MQLSLATTVGVITPILKKPTLDPTLHSNYRPLTMSSVISKLYEELTLPVYEANDSQFGFRESRGCDKACLLLNDVSMLMLERKSPLFLTSLDTAKCFDRVWHTGLFYKLYRCLPIVYWRFYHNWYRTMTACVKINNVTGSEFSISRGIRQGSKVSPIFLLFL